MISARNAAGWPAVAEVAAMRAATGSPVGNGPPVISGTVTVALGSRHQQPWPCPPDSRMPQICPKVLIRAFGWISFWDMTGVEGRNRSMMERT